MYVLRLLLAACLLLAVAPLATAQVDFLAPGVGPGAGNAFIGGGPNAGGIQGQPGQGLGFPGGAASADFDSLIDLIMATVAPDSWSENGGGEADIRPFPGGVWVDARGVLKLAGDDFRRPDEPLVAPSLRARVATRQGDVRQKAKLRCVSLPRLEAAIFHAMRDGKPLAEEMLTLAGLERVEYVFVYPDSREIVLAGPAGDWRVASEGRLVSTTSGKPVVRLDDLLVLMRREHSTGGKPFGCSITPRQENLAATQRFLARSAEKPLAPGRSAREKWLDEICETMGQQDIEVFGLDPASHAARVLVEADHHMKRVGLGLVDGAGVDNYLDIAADAPAGQPVGVMRWWFAASYQGLARNADSTALQLCGQGVRVLSENEMLSERGERTPGAKSDPAAQQFASDFTQKFTTLAQQYPVYGELRNLFDLAVVAALMESSDLYTLAGWQPVLFLDSKHLPLPRYRVPAETETIMAHRLVGKGQIVAAASGGVYIDAPHVVKKTEVASPDARLDYHRERRPENLAAGMWWWDLE